MTQEAWWGLAVLIVQGLVTWAYRLFNGRLTRAELRLAKIDDLLDRVNRRDSERENKTQVWYGKVEIRLALIEQRLRVGLGNGEGEDEGPPPKPRKTANWPR